MALYGTCMELISYYLNFEKEMNGNRMEIQIDLEKNIYGSHMEVEESLFNLKTLV